MALPGAHAPGPELETPIASNRIIWCVIDCCSDSPSPFPPSPIVSAGRVRTKTVKKGERAILELAHVDYGACILMMGYLEGCQIRFLGLSPVPA